MTTTAHTPTDELVAAFAQTTDGELLTMYARLTHMIHASASEAAASESRAQRDLVEAEALRRMAAGR